MNTNDGKLFYKDSSGVVQTMASKGTGSIGGSTTQVQFNNAGVLGGSASLTWNGTVLTSSGFAGPLNGTVGATTANTGSFTTLTTSSTITDNGGTANGVTYLNGSKVVTSGSALVFDGTNLSVGTTALSGGKFSALADLTAVNGLVIRDSATTYANNDNYILLQNSTGATAGGLTHPASGSLGVWGNDDIRFFRGTGATEQMRLDSTGLGVGTSSPTTKLDVFGSGDGELRLRAGSDAALIFSETAANKNWKLKPSAGDFLWQYSSTAYNSGYSNLMLLNTSGNLGLGVTPSAWTTLKVMQFAGGASLAGFSNTGYLNANSYFDGSWRYVATANAGRYEVAADHKWFSAASGTAGNAITFTQAMTLDASGNLGVGTSSPQAKIEAYQSSSGSTAQVLRLTNPNVAASTGAGIQWNLSTSNSVVNGEISVFRDAPTSGTMVFKNAYASGGTLTESMRIDSSGNVLIGTTSNANSDKLVVNGGVYQFQTVNGSSASPATNGGYLFGPNSATVYAGIRFINQYLSNNNTQLAFYTTSNAGSATEAGRFDGSGNLGIGTNSPSSYGKLAVVNGSTTASGARFENSSASITGKNVWSTYTSSGNNNTTAIHFAAYDGSVGGDVFRVYGNGNVVNNNNSYGAISDAKLKENIVDASPKLADLMLVRVRSYNLKTDTTHKQIGVVAQELEEVFPTMIEESPDRDMEGNDLGTTTKQVKYSVFVPMLIKAMQEQQAIIESLKARLDAANL
jgi:hypothetical protein